MSTATVGMSSAFQVPVSVGRDFSDYHHCVAPELMMSFWQTLRETKIGRFGTIFLSFFLILKNPIDQQKQVMAQVTVLDVVGFLP